MNQYLVRYLLLFTLLLATSLGAADAAPLKATQSFNLSLAPGAKPAQFTLPKISEAGCIIARVDTWKGNTALTLTIRGGRESSKAFTASQGPLWASYEVSASKVSQGWLVEATRGGGSETLTGTLLVEYPPTQVPCQLTLTPSGLNVTVAWTYNGRAKSTDLFLVERSSDQSFSSPVRICNPKAKTGSSNCTDTKLAKGSYWYRACLVSGGSNCGRSNVTPPLRATVR